MAHMKIYITNEDDNISVCSKSVILSIFVSDIVLYWSNEGCFTFIIHHLVWMVSKISPYLKKTCIACDMYRSNNEYKNLIG